MLNSFLCLHLLIFRRTFASTKLKNSINETDRQTDRQQFPTDTKCILIVVRYSAKRETEGERPALVRKSDNTKDRKTDSETTLAPLINTAKRRISLSK